MKYGTNSANFGESAKGYALRGVYIPKFGPISVKFSVLGVLYPYRCTDGGEIWHGRVDQISRHRCNVSPLWGENQTNAL